MSSKNKQQTNTNQPTNQTIKQPPPSLFAVGEKLRVLKERGWVIYSGAGKLRNRFKDKYFKAL